MALYKKNTNISIERDNPKKLILRNTVSQTKTAVKDEMAIKIISKLDVEDFPPSIEELTQEFGIHESHVHKILRPLVKRHFLVYSTENELFDNDDILKKSP